MPTPADIRLLLSLHKGNEPGDRSLKEYLIEQLAAREGEVGNIVRCEWCGETYRKSRRSQKFCKDECKNEFHVYARRFMRGIK